MCLQIKENYRVVFFSSFYTIAQEFKSEKGQYPELKFGDFNFPHKGDNLLGMVEFKPQQLYSSEKPMQEVFWLPIEPMWFNIATQLQVCY